MEQGEFAVLKATVRAQVDRIERIYQRIDERRAATDMVGLESLGYQLHNLYCAFEDLFRIIARAFENKIDDAGRYHAQLLWRMATEIEGVRPPLISCEAARLLDNLRAFRHFFRHAYGYELDPRKLAIVLEDALKLRPIYLEDIKAFLGALDPTLK